MSPFTVYTSVNHPGVSQVFYTVLPFLVGLKLQKPLTTL